MHYKKGRCSGGKHSKVRLTGLAAANAVGDKLYMFVIGRSEKPRSFKTSKVSLVNTARRKRGGLMVASLRNGPCKSKISSLLREER